MIMPFLRLVIIYIVVILGAVLVFKRDSVMSLLGMSWGTAQTEIMAEAPATPIETPVAAGEAETAAEAGAKTPAEPATPEAEQPPKYPTEQTAQTTAPTTAQPTAQPTAPTPRPTQAKTQTQTQTQTPSQAPSANDIQPRLEAARNAYWSRDLKGAEALYKSLIADAPTNADIKGELGNLYYGMRRMNEAADMYHKAGLQLIADGNKRQIMPLIGVLQSIAPDKANDLRSRLSQ